MIHVRRRLRHGIPWPFECRAQGRDRGTNCFAEQSLMLSPLVAQLESADAIDQALAALGPTVDSEEGRRKRLDLLRRRNALVPFYRLPPELVAQIVEVAARGPIVKPAEDWDPLRADFWCPHAPNLGFVIRFSRVSHWLRGIVLSTSRLWISPSFPDAGSRFAELALERALALPLSVGVTRFSEAFVNVRRSGIALNTITGTSSVLHDLWVFSCLTYWQDWMHSLLPTLFGLRTLAVEIAGHHSSVLAGLDTSHLTTLIVAGRPAHLLPLVGAQDSRFPQMTRLSLQISYTRPQDVSMVLDILERAPILEEFALQVAVVDDAWPRMEAFGPAGWPKPTTISKPGLVDVQMHGDARCIAALLYRTRLSPACSLQLFERNPSSVTEAESRVFATFLTWYMATQQVKPREMVLCTTARSDAVRDAAIEWDVRGFEHSGVGCARFILAIPESCTFGYLPIDWTALTTLRLDLTNDQYSRLFRERAPWVQAILDGPLETLAVHEDLLEHVFADAGALSSHAEPFPGLRLLRLILGGRGQRGLERVRRLLEQRDLNGYPLDRLVIETRRYHPMPEPSLLRLLSKSAVIVQHVHVNGDRVARRDEAEEFWGPVLEP
jgi:hypothetical protein